MKLKLTFDIGEEIDYEAAYEKIYKASGVNQETAEEISENFYSDNKYVDMTLEIVYDTETKISTRKLTLKEDE